MNAIDTISFPAAQAGLQYVQGATAAMSAKDPIQLKEWLECQDFILAMAGVCMNYGGFNLKSLRHIIINISDDLIAAVVRNPKINAVLPDVFTPVPFAIERKLWAGEMQVQCPDALTVLKVAALKDKREVMRYMQIVTTPVAAAFLGITEDMLNRMKSMSNETFGASYAGGHCYSLEELNLIAQNLQWACEWVYEKEVKHLHVDSTVLDYAVLVDEVTATAVTGTTPDELSKLLNRTEHTRRPYRLYDLEKIRLAKLKAQQQ